MISCSNPRSVAASVLYEALHEKKPLMATVRQYTSPQKAVLSSADVSFLKELINGILRNLTCLEFICDKLTARPFSQKNLRAKYIIITGLYQIKFMNTPPHAAVNETVKIMGELGLANLKGLANAVLRNYIRRKDEFEDLINKSYETKYSFPQWLISDLKKNYGKTLPVILEESNQHPPLSVRVNTAKYSIEKYMEILSHNGMTGSRSSFVPGAVFVTPPVNAENLPLFNEGIVFIQDSAAQYASILLDAKPDEVILDACAAPGGKTTHILELYPEIKDLVAMDMDKGRLIRVKDNLKRLSLENRVRIAVADATSPDRSWSPYEQYDRILLDAPCSATGVIRRHPDIKWLRTPEEITSIVEIQKKIIENLWQMLKPGGIMLYTTCSIMPQENSCQISNFLSSHQDARLIPLTEMETVDKPGLQFLPGRGCMECSNLNDNTDGFFYAKIQKAV